MTFHKQKVLTILEPLTLADTQKNVSRFSQFEQLKALMVFLTEKTAIIQADITVQKISLQIVVFKIFIRRCFHVNFQNSLRI